MRLMDEMFYGTTLSTDNYDALLNGWSTLTLQPNVTFSGGNSHYCHAETARQNIINNFGWTITDGGLDCSGGINTLDISEFASGVYFIKMQTETDSAVRRLVVK